MVMVMPIVMLMRVIMIAAAFHMVMVAFLCFANLGFKSKNLRSVFAQAAIHVVVAVENLLQPLNKGVNHFRVVVEKWGFDKFDVFVAGSHNINAIIDAFDQDAGEQKIREYDNAFEAELYSVPKGRFNQRKSDTGIGGFGPAKSKSFPQHAGDF